MLRSEEGHYRLLAQRTGEEWDEACRAAESALLRAALIGGQRGLRAGVDGPVEVSVTWAVKMGTRHPQEATCRWPDPGSDAAGVPDVAVIGARDRLRTAVAAAVRPCGGAGGLRLDQPRGSAHLAPAPCGGGPLDPPTGRGVARAGPGAGRERAGRRALGCAGRAASSTKEGEEHDPENPGRCRRLPGRPGRGEGGHRPGHAGAGAPADGPRVGPGGRPLGRPRVRSGAGAAGLPRPAWPSRPGSTWRPSCATDIPGEQILRAVRAWPADIIVIGRRDTGGVGEPYVGSETREVLEFCECPVLVVPRRVA